MGECPQFLREKREAILRLAEQHGARKVRVFGSHVRGEGDADSDVDLLVQMAPEASLLDRIAFLQDLEDLLGRKVDVVSERSLHWYVRDRVLREAVSL